MTLTVRELTHQDIPHLLNYWFTADEAFLKGMGVDVAKMIQPSQFQAMLQEQLDTPIDQKKSYCIIWLADDIPVGHSNAGEIAFGKQAKMHLHLWKSNHRQQGMGTTFIRQTLPFYFTKLKLQTLWCEPYAANAAPNSTLAKAGFEFIKEYVTVPGFINFEQPVKQWRMTRELFEQLNSNYDTISL